MDDFDEDPPSRMPFMWSTPPVLRVFAIGESGADPVCSWCSKTLAILSFPPGGAIRRVDERVTFKSCEDRVDISKRIVCVRTVDGEEPT